MKPIIGITACTVSSLLPKLDKGNKDQQEEYKKLIEISKSMAAMYSFNQSLQMVFENDLKAIENAGAVALIIPATENLENMEVILRAIDGVLITGGYDVAPKHYREEDGFSKGMLGHIDTLTDEEAGLFAKFSEKRDLAELNLVKKAYEKNIPIMGICRGCQVINIAMGGNIYQDIIAQGASTYNHSNIEKWNDIAHHIKIDKDSHLYSALNQETLGVNSIHHQSIKTLGNHLKSVAYADDGIVECIESSNDHFVLGVQWHPEMMAHDKNHQEILKYFVDQCKK